MDYEKAYTNAVARAKQAIKDCGHNEGRKRMIEDIFPELGNPDRIRQELIQYIADKPYPPSGKYSVPDFLIWLEKQCEPKWSEEDEKMRQDTICFIETGWTDNGKSHLISWLKSLKSQSRWKPTAEQMQSLYFAIITYSKKDDCKLTYDGLNSLYDDLKKL